MKYKWLLSTLFVWAIILCVPALRYHLHVATAGSPWIQSTILPAHYGDNYSFSKLKNPPLPIRVRQLQSNHQNIVFTTTKDALAPLDKLIRENPGLPWLVAVRLQVALGSYSGNRQGGEFSDARTYEEIQKGKPSIEKNNNKVNFTPQEMRDTLALCRQGEKLEPQNAYFTWMRFYFLMLNWQDKDAMKALSEAASKSYWNNHSAEYQQLYANAAKDVLGRQLTSYEKMSVATIPHTK
jgi:hypothetical protein